MPVNLHQNVNTQFLSQQLLQDLQGQRETVATINRSLETRGSDVIITNRAGEVTCLSTQDFFADQHHFSDSQEVHSVFMTLEVDGEMLLIGHDELNKNHLQELLGQTLNQIKGDPHWAHRVNAYQEAAAPILAHIRQHLEPPPSRFWETSNLLAHHELSTEDLQQITAWLQGDNLNAEEIGKLLTSGHGFTRQMTQNMLQALAYGASHWSADASQEKLNEIVQILVEHLLTGGREADLVLAHWQPRAALDALPQADELFAFLLEQMASRERSRAELMDPMKLLTASAAPERQQQALQAMISRWGTSKTAPGPSF